jgi:large subunit ribosomal protein L21
MFAVVETGGKQYRVQKDNIIVVEKLTQNPGETIRLDKVMAVGSGDTVKIGAPLVEGAYVEATVIEQKRDAKIIIFKKKRRHNYRRKNGHRQYITVLKVTNIHS